jgi:hypothetical protein
MQWEIVELNRLKQDKNRKYSCPVHLAVYIQTVEVTIYLTHSGSLGNTHATKKTRIPPDQTHMMQFCIVQADA